MAAIAARHITWISLRSLLIALVIILIITIIGFNLQLQSLRSQLDALRGEYDRLYSLYSSCSNATQHSEEIPSLGKKSILENNRTIILPPRGGGTFIYDIKYPGYIAIEFSSTTPIYFTVKEYTDEGWSPQTVYPYEVSGGISSKAHQPLWITQPELEPVIISAAPQTSGRFIVPVTIGTIYISITNIYSNSTAVTLTITHSHQ